MAWYNEVIPIFNPGTNVIPLIHIRDFAKYFLLKSAFLNSKHPHYRALHGLMENVPAKPQYVLAVEQASSNLTQIMRSLAKVLSDGRNAYVPRDEAFLYNDMTVIDFKNRRLLIEIF